MMSLEAGEAKVVVGLLMIASITGSAVGTAAAPDVVADTKAPVEIVVTGERSPRLLRDTPSSVEVLTADRIETVPGA